VPRTAAAEFEDRRHVALPGRRGGDDGVPRAEVQPFRARRPGPALPVRELGEAERGGPRPRRAARDPDAAQQAGAEAHRLDALERADLRSPLETGLAVRLS